MRSSYPSKQTYELLSRWPRSDAAGVLEPLRRQLAHDERNKVRKSYGCGSLRAVLSRLRRNLCFE